MPKSFQTYLEFIYDFNSAMMHDTIDIYTYRDVCVCLFDDNLVENLEIF